MLWHLFFVVSFPNCPIFIPILPLYTVWQADDEQVDIGHVAPRPRASSKFNTGDIVCVQPRSSRGTKDKEGGVGRVAAVYYVDNSFKYDINYLVRGGNEKQVSEEFISSYDIDDSSTSRSSRHARKTGDYSELNIDNDGNEVSSSHNKKRKEDVPKKKKARKNAKKSNANTVKSKKKKKGNDSDSDEFELGSEEEDEDEPFAAEPKKKKAKKGGKKGGKYVSSYF